MKRITTFTLAIIASALFSPTAVPQDNSSPSTQPKIIPNTRDEMKQALTILKKRQPRLPVPDAAPIDPAKANDPASRAVSVINGRARKFYLPEAWLKGESFGNEANALLDYKLKTECFWIVSRGNNCHYCLGHQEHKLKTTGLSDDDLGRLDRNWDELDARTKKAVAFARKLTLLPFAMSERDIAELKPEFNDQEVVELVYAIARFNSMNRWTDSIGIPQDPEMRGEPIEFEDPTASRWNQGKSLAVYDSSIVRPEELSVERARKELIASKTRKGFIKLATDDQTRKALEIADTKPISDYDRALAVLPFANGEMRRSQDAMFDNDELAPKIKSLIAWTTAINNRAWTSASMAQSRLSSQGVSIEQSERLIANRSSLSEAERVAVDFAIKLTNTPQKITDADIAGLRKHFSDRQTAHVIYCVCVCNSLDRFTESLGLGN